MKKPKFGYVVTLAKLAHDVEQLEYLEAQGIPVPHAAIPAYKSVISGLTELLQKHGKQGDDLWSHALDPGDEFFEPIHPFFNRLFNVPEYPRVDGAALNPSNN